MRLPFLLLAAIAAPASSQVITRAEVEERVGFCAELAEKGRAVGQSFDVDAEIMGYVRRNGGGDQFEREIRLACGAYFAGVMWMSGERRVSISEARKRFRQDK